MPLVGADTAGVGARDGSGGLDAGAQALASSMAARTAAQGDAKVWCITLSLESRGRTRQKRPSHAPVVARRGSWGKPAAEAPEGEAERLRCRSSFAPGSRATVGPIVRRY